MFVYVLNLRKIFAFFKFTFLFLFIGCISFFGIGIFNKYLSDEIHDVSAETGRVIVIDAGHGGEDPGAIGVNGIFEKNINLDIALLIGEELKSRGYTVVYTRTTDKMLYLPEENIKGMRKISDLKNRCKIASGYDDAIFVSIHMNSYGSSKYSGLQVYYKNESSESSILASLIQNSVKRSIQQSNSRQIKNGKDIYLLDHIESTAVLIECGFLSNKDECQKLSEKEYQKELSFSIVCGIIEYIEENGGV